VKTRKEGESLDNIAVAINSIDFGIVEFTEAAVHDVADFSRNHAMRTISRQINGTLTVETLRSVPPDGGETVVVTVYLVVGNGKINVTIFVKVSSQTARG
jgi:hypothetical protein